MTEPYKLNFKAVNDPRFPRADFKDLDGFACQIRQCSCSKGGITLGLVGPRDFGMMHLSREQAGAIGRALTLFAETGKLSEGGEAREAEIQDAIKNDDGDTRGVVFRDDPDY